MTDKRRGPQSNPNLAEVRRLEAENARLKRKLEQAEAIIDAHTSDDNPFSEAQFAGKPVSTT